MKRKMKLTISALAAVCVVAALVLTLSVPEKTTATGIEYQTVDLSTVAVTAVPEVTDNRMDSA